MKSFKLWRFDKILATFLSVHLIFFSIEAALVRTAAVALLLPIGVVGCSSEDTSNKTKEETQEGKCKESSLTSRMIAATMSFFITGSHHFYLGKWWVGILYLLALIFLIVSMPPIGVIAWLQGPIDSFYILFIISDEELCSRIKEGKIISSNPLIKDMLN